MLSRILCGVKLQSTPTAKACGFCRDVMLSRWELQVHFSLTRSAKAWHPTAPRPSVAHPSVKVLIRNFNVVLLEHLLNSTAPLLGHFLEHFLALFGFEVFVSV